jgi:hypothetical protein
MKPRLTTWIRAFSLVSIVFFGIVHAKGPFTIEVNDLSTNQSIGTIPGDANPYPNYKWYSLQLKIGEIRYISVKATFSLQRANPADYGQAYFINATHQELQWIEGWKNINRYRSLTDDREYVYENILIIKADNCQPGNYDFNIMGGYSESSLWKTGGDETGATIRIGIQALDTVQYSRPVLYPPSPFTPGTSSTLYWHPSRKPNIAFQDAYCFDSADSLNFKKSLRHVYKTTGDSTPAVFDGLLNGHRYGYFAKTEYQDGTALYSNFVYSTQDSIPPEGVSESLYMQYDGNGRLQMGWKNITDPKPPYGIESGIRHFVIYRAMDNEEEKIFCTQPYFPNDAFVNFDTTISPDAIPKYFRVRAVDRAGNEGDGDRTTNMLVDAVVPAEDLQPNDDPGHGNDSLNYCKSETLKLEYTLRRDLGDFRLVKFEVVRDDASFFDRHPSHGGRFFESPWIATAPGATARTEFLLTQSGQETLPKQFVNGHDYYWRVLGKSSASAQISKLPMDGLKTVWRVDCYPPDDIRNLKVESIVTDTSFIRWKFRVAWEKAADGGSGIKTYHVQRFIGAVLDTTFLERSCVFDDAAGNSLQGLSNELVSYRVLAEDSAGWVRDTTAWRAGDRALNGPGLKFDVGDSVGYHLKNDSTLVFNGTTVRVKVSYTDTTTLRSDKEYKVWINGIESVVEADSGNMLILTIPRQPLEAGIKIFKIKIRTLYEAHRSSVWSDAIQAVFHSLEPVQHLAVNNFSSYWKGDIHLKWPVPTYAVSGKTLPILDISHYLVRRRTDNQATWDTVATVAPAADTVRWSDFYGNGTLTANRKYYYNVVKVNLLGESSDPSNTGSAYCNRPPAIDSTASIKYDHASGTYCITVHWHRPDPNAIARNFTTHVRANLDTLWNPYPLKPDTVADDKLFYTHCGALPGHNYIFQVMEIPNDIDTAGWHIAWSQPRTIRFKVLTASVQPQPRGSISLQWDNQEVDTLRFARFQIVRLPGDTVPVSKSRSTYINRMTGDSLGSLTHRHYYGYRIHALDSLNQVVAAFLEDSVQCDTGPVYIPMIDRDTLAVAAGYFNDKADSLKIGFFWVDIDSHRVEGSTRGAVACMLQSSVSRFFTNNENQTCSTGWFPADPNTPFHKIKVPKTSILNNDKIYFRISAMDGQGNNADSTVYWSTYYNPAKERLGFEDAPTVVYDTVPPRPVPVDSVDIATAANDTLSGRVIRTVRWSGLFGELKYSDAANKDSLLLKNINSYTLYRTFGGNTDTVCTRRVGENYECMDPCANRDDRYAVRVLDRAGNDTFGDAVNPHFVETPAAPDSLGPAFNNRQGCTVSSNPGDSLLIEMAMLRRHFADAHRIGEWTPPGSDILSRSGWTAALTYLDTTGWGEIDADSVFFRAKAKKAFAGTSHGKAVVLSVESGWSAIGAWTNPARSGRPAGKPDGADPSGLPRDFGMDQNYPNPFNAGTQIAFRLAEASEVTLALFNIQGECTATLAAAKMPAGFHSVQWNGTGDRGGAAASGLYFAVLTARTETGAVLQKRIKLIMIR